MTSEWDLNIIHLNTSCVFKGTFIRLSPVCLVQVPSPWLDSTWCMDMVPPSSATWSVSSIRPITRECVLISHRTAHCVSFPWQMDASLSNTERPEQLGISPETPKRSAALKERLYCMKQEAENGQPAWPVSLVWQNFFWILWSNPLTWHFVGLSGLTTVFPRLHVVDCLHGLLWFLVGSRRTMRMCSGAELEVRH